MGLRAVEEPNRTLLDDQAILADLRRVVSDIAAAINEDPDVHIVSFTGLDGSGSGLLDYLYKPGLAGG